MVERRYPRPATVNNLCAGFESYRAVHRSTPTRGRLKYWALCGGSQGEALSTGSLICKGFQEEALCTGPLAEVPRKMLCALDPLERVTRESLVHWALGRGSQGKSLCTGPLVEGPKGRTRHRGTSADRKTSNSIHSGSPRPPINWGMFSTDKLYP